MIYSGKNITEPPQKIANDSYEAFKIECPVSIPIVNNRLKIDYQIENEYSLNIGPKKKQSKNSAKKSKQKESDSLLSDKRNETISDNSQTTTTIPAEKRKGDVPQRENNVLRYYAREL